MPTLASTWLSFTPPVRGMPDQPQGACPESNLLSAVGPGPARGTQPCLPRLPQSESAASVPRRFSPCTHCHAQCPSGPVSLTALRNDGTIPSLPLFRRVCAAAVRVIHHAVAPHTTAATWFPPELPLIGEPLAFHISRPTREFTLTGRLSLLTDMLMFSPGRRSRAQNHAYQPPAAPLSCAVLNRKGRAAIRPHYILLLLYAYCMHVNASCVMKGFATV
jgi:hypothetical protein